MALGDRIRIPRPTVDRTPAVRAPRAWTLPLLAAATLVVIAALALLPLRSPTPAGTDAPATEFSAARARVHIERIAQRPRPTGSATNADVRAYLVDQLRGAGLQPEVQRASAALSFPDHTAVAGRIHNIRATIPGTGGQPRVLLVAHYDSVMLGPGATDDGMGVATILELARVLQADRPRRNTVELLLTDAEEPGSIGAKAYTASAAAGDPARTVILNLEARGTYGRVVMFETGPGNGAFLSALRGHVPFATSVSDEIYRLLPNDTDLTVFRQAGFTGMNFAVVGDSARYDTELDDLAHQRLETLQDMGSTILAATRALSGATTDWTEADDNTYFTVFGYLVRYPAGLGVVVALLAAAAVTGAVWLLRPRGALLAAATVPVPLVISAAVSMLAWQVMVQIRPHYAAFLFGDPYRPGPAIAGLVVLTMAACLAWAVLLRRRRDPFALSTAVLCWFAGLGVLTALLVPGGSYLFAWPALIGAGGLAVASRVARDAPYRPLLAVCAAVPAIVLLAPLAAVLFPTAGLAFAAAPVILVALLGLTAVPLLRVPRKALSAALLAGTVLVGGVLVGTGTALDGPDARHPAQVGLYYVRDADTGRDVWLSDVDSGEDWLLRHVPEPRTSVEEQFPALDWPDGYRRGPASGGAPPVPMATVVADRRDGDVREVRLRMSVDQPAATAVSIYADQRTTVVVDATVDGQPVSGGRNRTTPTPWTWGVHFVAPGDGFDVTLRVRGDQPLTLRVLAYAAEVPANALAAPRPDRISWTAGAFGQSIGARTVRL